MSYYDIVDSEEHGQGVRNSGDDEFVVEFGVNIDEKAKVAVETANQAQVHQVDQPWGDRQSAA